MPEQSYLKCGLATAWSLMSACICFATFCCCCCCSELLRFHCFAAYVLTAAAAALVRFTNAEKLLSKQEISVMNELLWCRCNA